MYGLIWTDLRQKETKTPADLILCVLRLVRYELISARRRRKQVLNRMLCFSWNRYELISARRRRKQIPFLIPLSLYLAIWTDLRQKETKTHFLISLFIFKYLIWTDLRQKETKTWGLHPRCHFSWFDMNWSPPEGDENASGITAKHLSQVRYELISARRRRKLGYTLAPPRLHIDMNRSPPEGDENNNLIAYTSVIALRYELISARRRRKQ